MSRERILVVVVALVAAAFFGGRWLERSRGAAETPSKKAAAPATSPDVVPAPGVADAGETDARVTAKKLTPPRADMPPRKGQRHARVTIVEVSDFECPFCARGHATLEKLRAEFPAQIETTFVNLPLSFHPHAMSAATAALAAHQQGQFWPLYERLFGASGKLTDQDIRGYASELKLDMARFEADWKGPKLKERVLDDTAIAARLGVSATPAYFINGVQVSGAQPIEKFRAVIKAQLALADQLLLDGVPREKLHRRLWRLNNPAKADAVVDWLVLGKRPPKSARPKPQKRPPGVKSDEVKDKKPVHPAKDKTVWKVELRGDEPSQGDAKALLTAVLFTDFECPFCARVRPTLKQLEKTYQGKLRFVFKNQPLSFHKRAPLAAEAAMCAHRQGLFWPMEQRLFTHPKQLSESDLVEHATAVGADKARFTDCLKQHKTKGMVRADQREAASLEVGGTPTLFINGRKVGGAQPFAVYMRVVEQEMKRAQDALHSGVRGEQLYTHLIAKGKRRELPKPLSDKEVSLSLTNAPARRSKHTDAMDVTVFVDFQCPYCAKFLTTLNALSDALKGKVNVFVKHLPLSTQCNEAMSRDLHPGACLLARWVAAAGLQGRGWSLASQILETHSRFKGADTQVLEAALAEAADKVKLDRALLKTSIADGKAASVVAADVEEAARLGLRGTPSVFFGGREYRGPLRLEPMLEAVDLIRRSQRSKTDGKETK